MCIRDRPYSLVNISGGIVGDFFEADSSIVNIAGGTVGDCFSAELYSVVNISGGAIGLFFRVRDLGLVNISGGTFGAGFTAASGGEVNLQGSEFSIDGTPLDNLQFGQPVMITDRDVTLSGVLADGEPFSFDLNTSFITDGDFFSPEATLTVELVQNFLLGDCNEDLIVNFQDIAPMIDILSSVSFVEQADCNQDGVVNFFDVQPFIEILANSMGLN